MLNARGIGLSRVLFSPALPRFSDAVARASRARLETSLRLFDGVSGESRLVGFYHECAILIVLNFV